MISDNVNAVIEFMPAQNMVSVLARVTAEPARPLRWKLTVATASPGGTTNVSQAGSTRGESSAPVSSVQVNRDAVGKAVLVVEDEHGVVAQETALLPPPG